MFDIDQLEQINTAEIQILHPATGDELGAVATVHGQDSDVFIAETRKEETRYIEYARRNRNKPMPPEQRAAILKAKLVACTASITGLASKGQPFTDVEAVFTRFPWIMDQVAQGIMDRGNFMKGSSAK